MALSRATFLAAFPEFGNDRAPVELIDEKLAVALRRTPESIWGDLQEDGQGFLTAHLIATSPWGQDARLVAGDGSTTYEREYHELRRSVISGVSVA